MKKVILSLVVSCLVSGFSLVSAEEIKKEPAASKDCGFGPATASIQCWGQSHWITAANRASCIEAMGTKLLKISGYGEFKIVYSREVNSFFGDNAYEFIARDSKGTQLTARFLAKVADLQEKTENGDIRYYSAGYFSYFKNNDPIFMIKNLAGAVIAEYTFRDLFE